MKDNSNLRPNIPELAHYYDLAHENETSSEGAESRYTQHRLVAKGGMKTIESAIDSMTGREVAFATVKDDSLTTQFIKENCLS